jgi:UDP-glucose 4-epimerase
MKNIAIIGGTGFIGRNLTEYFINSGYSINVIGRSIDKIPNHKNLSKYKVDINDTINLLKSVENCEIIIWLVTSSIPSSSIFNFSDEFNNNINPIIKVLDSDKISVRFKKFIFISSGGTIYGEALDRTPITEDTLKSPISNYGLSKALSEDYIKFITKQNDFQSYILRPSNVYGEYQNMEKPQGIIGFALKSILNNTSIDLYGNGEVTRDFVYVKDVVKAFEKCILDDYKKAETKIYNVGSGYGLTIKQIIEKVSEIAGEKVITVSKPFREFDCKYNILNIDKIQDELNWFPETSIEQGLYNVWKWLKEKK